MERIPEPELMDDPAQAQAYADADFSQPHDYFVAQFLTRFPDFSSGQVGDLGCGPADITIRFARAIPEAMVVGVDGAAAMLALGCEAVRRAGLESRIRLEQRLLPARDWGNAAFDAVISNSLLHHLDDPTALWQTVANVAKPGAPVLVMDLMRPPDRAGAERLRTLYAAGAPAVLQRDFYNSLLAAYQPREVREQLRQSGLDYLTVEVASDRHLIVHGRYRGKEG